MSLIRFAGKSYVRYRRKQISFLEDIKRIWADIWTESVEMKCKPFISRLILPIVLVAAVLSSCSRTPKEESETTQATTEVEVTISESDASVPASLPEPTPMSERNYTLPVYDDTVQGSFIPGTWGEATCSTEESTVVNGGMRSISVRCGAWEAFELTRRSEDWEEIYYFYPNHCRSLTFAFNPGGETKDDEDLCVSLDLGEEIPIFDLIDGEVAPDTWYEVTVPLLDLNPEAMPMARLVFFNRSEADSSFYIDDLVLNCKEDRTSPVISYVAIEVGALGKSAVVRFSTSENAKAEFRYGIGSATETVSTQEYRTEHEISVSGLISGEQYVYALQVSDYPQDDGTTVNQAETEGTFVATPNYAINEFVRFSIDTTQVNGDISPYIYGCNFFDPQSFDSAGYTLGRLGGNRWTAYNWENNASNAGSDWYFHNDGYLSESDVPGFAVVERVTSIFENDSAALVTVPILGYVARDKDGTDVTQTEDYLDERFRESRAFKGGPLSLVPSLSDRYVYQNEFVYCLENAFPLPARGDLRLMYCLDNEPALWSSTHSPIRPEPVTYTELTDKNIEFASAVKSVAPEAMVFGFVGYGYNAFVNLQNAPDSAKYGEFIDYYLTQLAEAEDDYGSRLVDVLDLHWYPEAQSDDGERITSESGEEEVSAARIQAPRSLWDPTYEENSWIADYIGGPVCLIPWLRDKIDRLYPGTGLAITEYYFGGSRHISGAIAQADFLGVAGREGVFAACLWPMADIEGSFIEAAFDMFLDYDGNGSHFGDISIQALSGDNGAASVYASVDSNDPDRLVIIAINKTDGWTEASIDITAKDKIYTSGASYVLTETSVVPELLGSFEVDSEMFTVDLSPMSVTCIVLSR